MPAIHLLSLEKETEVAKALRAASCLICPTLEDNLPNVVLEALACGCPVLAFSTGGIPDMVTHGQKGLLTPKGDVLGLARLILEFCSNRTLREDLKTNVRSIDLASFALETQASTLRKLYQTAAFVKTAVPLELDPLPFQTVEVKLIQHFGTEIVAVLLEEKARNKLTQSATIAELRWDLARAGEKITEADRATEEAEKKLLMEEVSTTNLRDALESSEFKIGNALRKLTNLTSKLQAQKRVSCHLKKLSERRTINGQTRRLFRWLSGKR